VCGSPHSPLSVAETPSFSGAAAAICRTHTAV
jgi:DNA-binding transcriptional LysR family regulator